MKSLLLKDAVASDESSGKLFSNLYSESSFLGKIFFSFAKPLLNQLLKDEKFDDTKLLSLYGGRGGSQGAEQEISNECNLFIHVYAEQRDIKKRSVQGAMLATLFIIYRRNFLLCLTTAILAEVFAIYCCYNVGYLTEFMISIEKTSQYQIQFLILFSLAFLGQIFLRNLHYFLNALLSLKLKRLFMSSLYRKLSKLSLDSMGEISDGKLISLLQSFIFILEKILVLVYYCAVAPVMMLIACALISIKGGLLYALIVQAMYLSLFLIQWGINKLISKIIVTESGVNDKRIGLVYQLLLGLRTIKCFGLETFFLDKVLKMRETQVKFMRIQTALSSIGWALLNNSGYFISLAILLIAWHANSYLNVSFSFSTLTILAYLSTAILSLSLGGMTGVFQFQHVCTRVGTILDLQEQKSLRMLPESRLDKAHIKMNDCAFTWSYYSNKTSQQQEAAAEEGPKLALQNLNFSLRSGELMVVVGQVGCGKTTFLKSILNETKLVRGEMEIKGRMAYVEQDPFIFPGTVKDNILFGKEYDREKFSEVIKLCELESDFKQMENGENTVMGDAGCNVSGGQKARISLARALYEDADIYLLDNPISALDAQISLKIVENVVKGYLKSKCTILITSQPKIVPQIDKILVIDYGYQIRFGTPEEIYQDYGYLNEMISNEPSEAYTDMVCQAEETDEHEICLTEKGDNDSVKVGKETIITPKVEEKIERTAGVGDAAAKIFSKYALGPLGVVLYVFLSAIPPLLLISAIYWLGFWAAYPFALYGNYYANRFMITVGLAVLFTIARNIYSYYLILLGSNRIHNLMIERVLRGSITFFDINPAGKLITRFAKDQFLVDQKLNFFVLIFSESLFAAIGSLLYSIVITPFAAIPVVTLVGISIFIYRKCSAALVVLQKYENNSRDPLQANILTMLSGIITCRAYDNVKFFADPFEKQLQKSVNCSFSYVSIIRWQGLRVQLVGGLFTLSIAWLAVLLKEQVNSSLLSVLMVFVMDIAAYILVSILFYAEYQYCMPSVERMLHLTEIKQEDALIQPSDSELINWPQQGHIKFNGVQMRYREDLEPAVKDVTFEIESGMKVGIVGRTGAGKSSILQSLFRLIDLSAGQVDIDGINIKTLGLHTLRKKIGFIPQQPFLFSGTVRENLDPFNERTDEEIISVLKKTYLWDYISTLNGVLEHSIFDPNLTFSQGGKQLMCLARELLRDCRIMVLDEATANIDQYTDQLIQKTLREECKNQTMLTIAHRISTVIDADRILVMEKGRVAEYDHPFKLLTLKDSDTEITNDGYFAKMVKAYADDEQKWLFNIAKAQYFKFASVEFDTVTECSYMT